MGGIAFIVLLLFGGLSSCSLFGGNSGQRLDCVVLSLRGRGYTGAESAYAAMEAELQDMLDNIESEYPGYDEYRVNADEIEHDPYVLISILSAWHEGVFTLDEVQSTLEMLFEKQYILTVEEEVQVRYRTETRTDSEGNPYTVEVPYNYYILHVDLENFNLSHVPVYIMGEEQLSMYAMYMSSLGNRPDLFPQSGYVSKYYENPPADYEVPAALLGSDEKFARLMEEADKYVGFPYVWGGSTPETSFDCSGFVSYVLTNSGLYNTGRLGRKGFTTSQPLFLTRSRGIWCSLRVHTTPPAFPMWGFMWARTGTEARHAALWRPYPVFKAGHQLLAIPLLRLRAVKLQLKGVEKMNIVSFGGGTNSAALLIGLYKHKIPIDLITFADTGAEHPHTYQFIEIINQWLAEHGMPQITVVQYVDRYGNRLSLETECLRSHTLPSIAYGHKRCSQKHKIAPQEKFCNHYAPCREVWQRGEKVNRYIGYDAEK